VPVIAMTAHAMKGDRERFLAAGMDGYVAKPIRDQELWEALDAVASRESLPDRWQPAETASAPGQSPPDSGDPVDGPTLDRDAVLARVGGNLDLLRNLSQVFGKNCSSLTTEIRAALDRRHITDGVRPAHTLKGVVGFFGTPAANKASQELETLVKKGDVAGASAALSTLLVDIEGIQQSLALLVSPDSPAAGGSGSADHATAGKEIRQRT
jgi:two-component system, sensor histidine kinase and response regulator